MHPKAPFKGCNKAMSAPPFPEQLLRLRLSYRTSGSAVASQAQPLNLEAQPLRLNSLAKVCVADAKLLYGDGGAGEAARGRCQR